MCTMQNLYPPQLCARDINRGSMGHDMREQMSCGRTRSNRICGYRVFCEGWVLDSLNSLKYIASGEGNDYPCHHWGGLVVPFPIIPGKRGICYVIND